MFKLTQEGENVKVSIIIKLLNRILGNRTIHAISLILLLLSWGYIGIRTIFNKTKKEIVTVIDNAKINAIKKELEYHVIASNDLYKSISIISNQIILENSFVNSDIVTKKIIVKEFAVDEKNALDAIYLDALEFMRQRETNTPN